MDISGSGVFQLPSNALVFPAQLCLGTVSGLNTKKIGAFFWESVHWGEGLPRGGAKNGAFSEDVVVIVLVTVVVVLLVVLIVISGIVGDIGDATLAAAGSNENRCAIKKYIQFIYFSCLEYWIEYQYCTRSLETYRFVLLWLTINNSKLIIKERNKLIENGKYI